MTAASRAGRRRNEPELAERLYGALAHGDDEHRQWLRDAIQAFFAGLDIPAPRGSGNKGARIAELERQLASVDTHAKRGDVEQAPSPMGSAVPPQAGDAQPSQDSQP